MAVPSLGNGNVAYIQRFFIVLVKFASRKISEI
jgi:hypothetical protein